MSAIDLAALAALELNDGIWIGPGSPALSYPAEGLRLNLELEDRSYWFAHRNRAILELARRFSPGAFLLDVGAGNGFVARALSDAGVPTIALEPQVEGARAARQRGLPYVVCSSLEAARFRPGSLPAVGLFDVLEHLADDAAFLGEVRELLTPGGRLYLNVPALPALWSVEDDYAGHFRRYTRKSLRGRLESAGFEVEWTSYLFAALVVPLFLLRALPSRLGLRRVDARRNARELTGGASGAPPGLARLLERELARLRGGESARLGTSCLAVARRAE